MKKKTSPGIHLVKSKGKYFWRLKGKNGKDLARSSEVYNSKQACVKSIKAAQKAIFTDKLYDWTSNHGVIEKWIKH